MKYIQQKKISELIATVLKENTVRADEIPLVVQVTGANNLAKGTKVRIKLGAIDEITLDVSATVIEKLTDGEQFDSALNDDEDAQEEDMAASVSNAMTIEPAEELTAINAE